MNERIAALIDKMNYSGLIYQAGDREMSVTGKDLEYFAELIVRECAQVSEDDITDGDACCTNTADRIARQIKKHFGVEE